MSSPTRVEERPVAVADNDLHAWTLAVSRDRIIVAVWTAAACLAAVEAWFVLHGSWGWDSVTYWSVWSQPTMYGIAPHTQGAYLYSPAFAQVIYPLTLLPRGMFTVLWLGFGACAYYWMIRPAGWVWGVPLAALALEDLRVGNITWLVALSLVLGLRRSPVWLVPALTKVTPAVVVLWLVPRREWREVLVFVGAALAVTAASVSLAPSLWADWVEFLMSHGHPMAVARLAVAAALVLVASRRDWPWLLPWALIASSPVPALYVLGFLCALPRLLPAGRVPAARSPVRSRDLTPTPTQGTNDQEHEPDRLRQGPGGRR